MDNAWYVDFGNGTNTGYFAVAAWSNHTAAAGEIIRQLTAPAVGSERCFVCTTAGATGAVEPTWTNTRGALNTSSVAVYQECTGIAALNGDATNTPSWTITATPPGGVKNTAVTLGQVIKRDNGASYQICTVAGTAGNGAEPGFSDTAGVTTADNTVTWTSLGVVGNFTGWQAPHARLANAFASTWGQAGNSFFLATEHAETQSASPTTLNAPGTITAPCFIYCVTKTNVPPTSANISTGATISQTGGNNITFGAGYSYWVASATPGILFQDSGNTIFMQFVFAGNTFSLFKNCQFSLNSSTASKFQLANTNSTGIKCIFDGCNFTFGSNTSQTFNSGGNNLDTDIRFRNCTFSVGANIPTTVWTVAPGNTLIEGCDLSAFGSGKTLIGASGNSIATIIKDCKLGASVTVAATPTVLSQSVYVIRSDSSGTNYRHEKYDYTGTQTVETTIVRTGGASDGTTTLSWKLVATANSKWILPFECIPITIWNDSTSAITTLTIYGTTTGGGVPNNDDIWITAEYLKDAGDPQGGFQTTTKSDNLAASTTTNNSSDASTWGGGGAGNGFKMVVPSFTPAQKGPITLYIYVAKASATYYIDPRPSISGVTVSKSFINAPTVYTNELSAGGTAGIIVNPGMDGGMHG